MKPFVAAAFFLALAGAASAASVTFTSGVRVVDMLGPTGSAFSGAAIGDLGTISFTYNDATAGTGINPRTYNGAFSSMSLTIDGQTYSWGFTNVNPVYVTNQMRVFDDSLSGGDGIFNRALDGDPDVASDFFINAFFQGDPSVLGSAAQPSSIDVNDWDGLSGNLSGFAGSGVFFGEAVGGSSQANQILLEYYNPVIPLPSAAGLGFAGLALLGARRRR